MSITDRIRQLQSNVVGPRLNAQRQRDEEQSALAANMTEDQFTDAFKRQVVARDAGLVAEANKPAPQAAAPMSMEDNIRRLQSNVVKPGMNAPAAAPPQQQAARPAANPQVAAPARDTHAERVAQLTEAGMSPDQAQRTAALERQMTGPITPGLSDANNTPEMREDRRRRVTAQNQRSAAQDNYARSQLDGHLTAAEAVDARARQEGLRPGGPDNPSAREIESDRILAEKDRLARAGVGVDHRNEIGSHAGLDTAAALAEDDRKAKEWDQYTRSTPALMQRYHPEEAQAALDGTWRKQAQADKAKYGDGSATGKLTPEQYEARIERRNAERAATNPDAARTRMVEKMARDTGKTVEEVEKDMFPNGRPQASPEYLARQDARKQQRNRANEAIWERNGYTGHLDAKTSSGDAAVAREGLTRLHQITGNPVFAQRLAEMDAADAAKVANDQATRMQDAQFKQETGMETLRQTGAEKQDGRTAAEKELERKHESGERALDRGHELTATEAAHKQRLEELEKTAGLDLDQKRELARLQEKQAAADFQRSEQGKNNDSDRKNRDADLQLPRTKEEIAAQAEGQARVEGAKIPPTPSASGRERAREAINAPGANISGLEDSMTNDAVAASGGRLSPEDARAQVQQDLKASALEHADRQPGDEMSPGVRGHLEEEIKGQPDASGKMPAPMSQEQFRQYAVGHGMTPQQADRIYIDITKPPVPSAGAGDLPPVPAGTPGPMKPRGSGRRGGGAWSMPTPEEVDAARKQRAAAAEAESRKQKNKHPYSPT